MNIENFLKCNRTRRDMLMKLLMGLAATGTGAMGYMLFSKEFPQRDNGSEACATYDQQDYPYYETLQSLQNRLKKESARDSYIISGLLYPVLHYKLQNREEVTNKVEELTERLRYSSNREYGNVQISADSINDDLSLPKQMLEYLEYVLRHLLYMRRWATENRDRVDSVYMLELKGMIDKYSKLKTLVMNASGLQCDQF